ncbi:Asp23/Gls24 family envelope stress response protein [Alkalicella caledoniensis]|uniref:Asp23/Gls24 family envelope stress response protein n=1 Tax=Alkalicella caledoniensis TaxID=2731377 RepID=A0A7G9WBU0_ALKCA|nr:Asp23/Gls24 family envelope stress response protein [Alkalicella caledoniensis]QNO16152.1 Asp23/Gls24 family envelope stress response protein [Alkalicella caledoniensis]
MEHNFTVQQGNGTVRIADEVVSIIAGIAATDIKGVAGMSGGIAGGFAEMLGKKNLSKGVKVNVGDTEATIDLYIIVEYGFKIPEVSEQIQIAVKQNVETMTGLNVLEINVHVQGVRIQGLNTDKEKEEMKLK